MEPDVRRLPPPCALLHGPAASIVAWALCLMLPGVAGAQVSLEIGPGLGLYLPLQDYRGPAPGYVPVPPPDPIPGVPPLPTPPSSSILVWSQRNALALGAELGAWFSDHVGATVSWRRMSSEVSIPWSFAPVASGTVNVATGELQVMLGDPDKQFRLLLNGGVAWVGRSGPAFANVTSEDAVGGVLGIGSRIRLNDRLTLNARLRGVIYNLQLEAYGEAYPSVTQVDLLGEMGLMVRVF